jgi:hypothetical protein
MRLKKKQAELQKLIDAAKKKMNIKDYESKVPEDVRTEQAAKLSLYENEFKVNEDSMEVLSKIE